MASHPHPSGKRACKPMPMYVNIDLQSFDPRMAVREVNEVVWLGVSDYIQDDRADDKNWRKRYVYSSKLSPNGRLDRRIRVEFTDTSRAFASSLS